MIPVKITFSELTWRFANFILKNFAKMRCAFDTYLFRNFCNAHIRTLKKRFCIKNTHGSYILHNVNPHSNACCVEAHIFAGENIAVHSGSADNGILTIQSVRIRDFLCSTYTGNAFNEKSAELNTVLCLNLLHHIVKSGAFCKYFRKLIIAARKVREIADSSSCVIGLGNR